MTDAERALARCRRLADLLDSAVDLPMVGPVGLDPLLGLVPVVGDALPALLSLYVVVEAYLAGVGWPTLVRMLFNIAVDALVGSIPVAGDLFDAKWRANQRNVALFERHVDGS
jgi:hypothetical protein